VSARIKICGVTRLEDARVCVEAGADAIGLNFWPQSKRRCGTAQAARIVADLGDRARVVGVFVDASLEEIQTIRRETGVRWAQLHGDEPSELLEALGPDAYKALRPTGAHDLDDALSWPGDELLLDACVAGMPGGTGQRADWTLAAKIARARKVWLAGGLTPDNVAEAIASVAPFGVDVASGVESAPGLKDEVLVRRFVVAARN
jgi:phosphoribosylanthranilate isomerase